MTSHSVVCAIDTAKTPKTTMPPSLAEAPGPAAALAAIAAVPPPPATSSLRDDDCLLRTTREFVFPPCVVKPAEGANAGRI